MCGNSSHGPQYHTLNFIKRKETMDPWPGEEIITHYHLKHSLRIPTLAFSWLELNAITALNSPLGMHNSTYLTHTVTSMLQQDIVQNTWFTFQPYLPCGLNGNLGPWGMFLFLGQIPYSVITSQGTTRIIHTQRHKQTRQDLISPILVKCSLQLSPLLMH